MRILTIIALVLMALAGCSNKDSKPSIIDEQANVNYSILLTTPEKPLSFMEEVQPILDKRCVVCHGCYDAPCQLKLNSHAGITRGANPDKVYNGLRITPAPKTRLFVDARSTEEWRDLKFHPVVSETPNPTPSSNLDNSVMYQMLRLKQRFPQPNVGMLSADIDTSLNRKQVCTNAQDFNKFARKNPNWGMPFALPNLPANEYKVLVQWLAQGAPNSPAPALAAASQQQVGEWEEFLNQQGLREELVSRYIYEHLVQGHIYFAGAPDSEYFRLIRSTTPPGEPAIELASERPYSDPGQPFWYRLKHYVPHIVIKDHVPYQWSPAKMARYKELFYDVDYRVNEPAPYGQELASNPFRAFQDIPADSRYRFMLDDARFYLQGFIKGPVCRGQIALNVIEDQFWIMFVEPDRHLISTNTAFLKSVTNDLELPDNRGNTLNVTAIWTDYWKRQKSYLQAREKEFVSIHTNGLDGSLNYLWDGDGTNQNAALTIFRHEDSASVSFGHLGDYPETAWVIDYPLLERIHYLLVVGYDVYGNVGHQLNTRLYMDFLRMEGEDFFLTMMPPEQRKAVRDSWYVGVHAQVKKHFDEPQEWLNIPSNITLTTDAPVKELLTMIDARLGPMAGPNDVINRCDGDCSTPDPALSKVDNALRMAAKISGRKLLAFPDDSFIRIEMPDGQPDLSYSLIVNKSYKNLTTMLENDDKRDPDGDTLTILPGLTGSYPNFFYSVELDQLDQFVASLATLASRDDYERFVALYGVRRTNPEFWAHSDWFHNRRKAENAIEAGIFDLNRYSNR